ncbi:hypothetical protein ABIA32_002732 [Streptacidiphilus sp. MAP12-20]|uniref:hypothetical protein n=1 Tax=Streptacidiphilus sp. MAP12-20 TaxID=3156299 RepID=UPI003515AA39
MSRPNPEALLWPGVSITAVGALSLAIPLLILGFALMAVAVGTGSVRAARQVRSWWRRPTWREQVLAAVDDLRDELIDAELAELLHAPLNPTSQNHEER